MTTTLRRRADDHLSADLREAAQITLDIQRCADCVAANAAAGGPPSWCPYLQTPCIRRLAALVPAPRVGP